MRIKKFLSSTLLISVLGISNTSGIIGNVAATIVNAETKSEVFDFTFANNTQTDAWNTSYTARTVEGTIGNVEFTSANKQSSTSTITKVPVTKGQPVVFKANTGIKVTGFTLECVQWGTKAQTITYSTSTDGGVSYTKGSSSTNFSISASNLEDVNAVKFTFSSTSNQVGIKSLSISYEEVQETLPTYSVTVNGGTADKENPQQGESVTLTPTEPEGKIFTYWTDDNDNNKIVSYLDNYSFLAGADASYTANYTDSTYFVDLRNNATGDGTSKVSNLLKYSKYENITSIDGTNAYPDSKGGVKLGTSGAAGSIKINLATGWTATGVKIKAGPYNTTSDDAKIKVNDGEAQEITEIKYYDYSFDASNAITVAQAVATKGRLYIYTIELTGVTYTAPAAPVEIMVTGGSTDKETYYKNDLCTISAVVPENKVFTYWTKDEEVIYENPYKFTVGADNVAYEAHFADATNYIDFTRNTSDTTYAVSDLTTLGVIYNTSYIDSISAEKAYLTKNSDVRVSTGSANGKITIKLENGWTATGIKINGSQYGSDAAKIAVNGGEAQEITDRAIYSYTFDADNTITIAATKRSYIYTIEFVGLNYVEPSVPANVVVTNGTANQDSYIVGDTATITATVPEGKLFTYWAVGETKIYDPTYTFEVTGDVTYTAHFADNTNYIDFANSSKTDSTSTVKDLTSYAIYSNIASISGTNAYPNSTGGIKMASSKADGSMTITLATGWTATGININGKQYGSDAAKISVNGGEELAITDRNIYSVTFETANVITIEFSKRSYIYNIELVGLSQTPANITVNGGTTTDTSYVVGDTVTIKANVPEGKVFTYWTLGDTKIYTPTYTFEATGDATYTANFVDDTDYINFATVTTTTAASNLTANGVTYEASYTSSITGTYTYLNNAGYVNVSNSTKNGTITITLKEGYTATGLVVNGEKVDASATLAVNNDSKAMEGRNFYTYSFPASNTITISATKVVNIYNIKLEGVTYTAPTAATINVVNGTATYDNLMCTITPETKDGQVFAYWTNTAGVVISTATYTFKATVNDTYTAHYVSTSNIIDFSTNTDDDAFADNNLLDEGITYNADAIANLTATYSFLNNEGIKVGTSSKDGTITITLADGYTVTGIKVTAAQFDEASKLTANGEAKDVSAKNVYEYTFDKTNTITISSTNITNIYNIELTGLDFTQLVVEDTTKIENYMQGASSYLEDDGKGIVRILGVVDERFETYGFDVTIDGTTHSVSNGLRAYTTVLANFGEVAYTAKDLGGRYIYGGELYNMEEGTYTITVRAWVVDEDGAKHYSDAKTYSIIVSTTNGTLVTLA